MTMRCLFGDLSVIWSLCNYEPVVTANPHDSQPAGDEMYQTNCREIAQDSWNMLTLIKEGNTDQQDGNLKDDAASARLSPVDRQ